MASVLRGAVPFADIELIVQLRGSAMRWGLSEGARVEVWRGTQLLGTLSGETLRQLVAQHLSTVALVTAMQATLAGSGDPEPPPRPLPQRLPPSKDTLSREAREARAAQRRTRKPPQRA